MKRTVTCGLLLVIIVTTAKYGNAATEEAVGMLNPLVVSEPAAPGSGTLPGISTVDEVSSEAFREKNITTVRRALELVPNVVV